MSPLVAAIITRFQANATLSPAISGPWLDVAPEGRAFPYCQLIVIGGQKPDYGFSGTHTQDIRIRFTIMDTDSTTLFGTYHPALQTQFKWYGVALTSGTLLTSMRVFELLRTTSLLSKDNKPVYSSVNDYLFKITATN